MGILSTHCNHKWFFHDHNDTHTTVLLLFWSMSGTTRVSRYQKGKTRKVKTNLDLLEQETVSGSGICWAIRKSAPYPRQPRQHPNTQFFTGRMPFLAPNQQRQSTEGHNEVTPKKCQGKQTPKLLFRLTVSKWSINNFDRIWFTGGHWQWHWTQVKFQKNFSKCTSRKIPERLLLYKATDIDCHSTDRVSTVSSFLQPK